MRPEGTTACCDLMNIKFRAGTDWDSVLASSPTSWTVYIRGPKRRGVVPLELFFFFGSTETSADTSMCVCV